MGALRYYPTKSKDWLLARLDEVLNDDADGIMSTSSGAGDVNTSGVIQGSTSERKRKLLHDLAVIDPDGDWADHIPSRVTRAVFKD